MGPPARRASHAIVHAATGTAAVAVGGVVIAGVLGVATWIAMLIVIGVVAAVIVVAASYVLRRL